ncbi:MAG: UDP-2,3-diacylglucosamine diphosphatase LpxI [Pseudomonadota bacterium]
MASGWRRLGVVAGSGALPVRILEAERSAGREPFAVRLFQDEALTAFEHRDHSIAEPGAVMKSLKKAGCDAVCFAGVVKRPNFAALRPDWQGAMLLPKVVSAARQGDGAIIDVIVALFEKEGFTIVAAEDAAGDLRAAPGPLGQYKPQAEDFADIHKATQLIEALGPFDVGQGAVVRRGFVLAVEAAEGTDAMLDRCAQLPDELKGQEPGEKAQPRGVLVKVPKPAQERRVDLPTIGVPTVERLAAAGLAGVAVRVGAALIVDQQAVREAADQHGLFVYGFTDDELTGQ